MVLIHLSNSKSLFHAWEIPVSSRRVADFLAPCTICLIVACVTLRTHIVVLPLNRLIELGVCRQYYEQYDPSFVGQDGNVKESHCKSKTIQTSTVELLGLVTTLGIVYG